MRATANATGKRQRQREREARRDVAEARVVQGALELAEL